MKRSWLLLAVLVAAGCKQDLTVPGHCPEFCPSGQPEILEFVLEGLPDADSTFFGYAGWEQVRALLAGSGLAAGEARAWYAFEARADSVTVRDTLRAYTIDSVIVTVNIVARDSTIDDLVLELYRLPITTDTLDDFATVNAAMNAGSLVDSVAVPDSILSGAVRFVLAGDVLDRLAIPPEDSGLLTLGFNARGAQATGVRLGSRAGTTGPASMLTYVKADVPDTVSSPQVLSTGPVVNGYVIDDDQGVDPTLLYVGRIPAARSLLRFRLPPEVTDSASLLRATLELTPDRPLFGLPNDATGLQVSAIRTDLGAKSTPIFSLRITSLLKEGSTDVITLDVGAIVNTWIGGNGFAPVLYLSMTPEGDSFYRPVFRSSRSVSGKPQLRVTFLIPPPVERP